MRLEEAVALALSAAICAALAVFGACLRKGKGLQFIAGNQNAAFENPGSPEQLRLGKRVGTLLIAIAAAVASLTVLSALSLFGAFEVSVASVAPLLVVVAVLVLGAIAVCGVAAARTKAEGRGKGRGGQKESRPRGEGVPIETQQRIAFGALIALQLVIQATLIVAIWSKSA